MASEDAPTAASQTTAAQAIVYRQLAQRDRTRAQLAKKLAERGVNEAVAAEVLDSFEIAGLVNDANYAERYAEYGRTERGLSRRGISAKLAEAGVAPELIADALESYEAEPEREVALELARKKAPSSHGLDRDVRFRRIAGFLARRGFPSSIVVSVTREVLDNEPEIP
ncbi:regulatory protein [Ruaniaceae bacterium KH17]|nr:regulatory protein [Ruaniaceae bacterium KH17]